MAKKYLLYIHEERFLTEPSKSQLVNNLLERHYHGTVDGKTQEEIHADIRAAQKAILSAKVPTEDRVVQFGNGRIASTNGLCKLHGLPLDSRGRCLQKGCKYS